jgi:hypothetical protein
MVAAVLTAQQAAMLCLSTVVQRRDLGEILNPSAECARTVPRDLLDIGLVTHEFKATRFGRMVLAALTD